MKATVARAALSLIGRRDAPRPPDNAVLLSALPVPVVLLDPQNRFRFLNHAAEQFLGISSAQAARLPITDLLPADSPVYLMIDHVRRHEVTVADYDMTIEGLEAIARHAEAAVTALGEGDFDAAVTFVTQGSFITPYGHDDGTVWETLVRWVKKCRDIADQLEQEDN